MFIVLKRRWFFVLLAQGFFMALSLGGISPRAEAAEFTHANGMTFIDIPAGSFQMGSCKKAVTNLKDANNSNGSGQSPLTNNCAGNDLDASINELPRHKVNIASFQMSKTEVTLGTFKRYIVATDRDDLVTDEFMSHNGYGDEAPVVLVSWNDAKSFIEWVNKSKAATDKGIYRLPSEAEWEYSCRAGGDHRYCGSRIESTVAWHQGNSGQHQQAVAKKDPNSFGLHDMSGNVWEWVEDCYHDNYRDAPTDGSAWVSACNSSGRVVRGGSWKGSAQTVRATARMGSLSVSRNNHIGFRLARTLP